MKIEYILNGKPVKVKPEHEQQFLQNNPTAIKSTVPGKSQEAGQPQTNQQTNTELQSGDGSSVSLDTEFEDLQNRFRSGDLNFKELKRYNKLYHEVYTTPEQKKQALKENLNYRWNNTKDLGLGTSAILGLTRGVVNLLTGDEVEEDDSIATQVIKESKVKETEGTLSEQMEKVDITQTSEYDGISGVIGDNGMSEVLSHLVRWGKETVKGTAQEAEKGVKRGELVQPGIDIIQSVSRGSAPRQSDLQEIIEKNIDIESVGTSEAVKGYQKVYDANKEKHGGVAAWIQGVFENPAFIMQTSVGSMALIGSSFVNSETARKRALKSGIGTTAAANIPTGKGKLVNFLPGGVVAKNATAFMSGMMGAVSGTMEQSFTFVELMQEELKRRGEDFTIQNMKSLLLDDKIETYKDPRFKALDITGTPFEIFKKRATRRGLAIGFVDGISALIGGSIVNRAARKINKKGGFTYSKKQIAGIGTGTAVAGGIGSEVAGQTLGGQEYDAGEILTEGFAEKGIAMTGITTIPTLLRGRATYQINGEYYTEQEFNDITKNMSDIEILELLSKPEGKGIDIKNDNFTLNRIKQRGQDGYLDTQIDVNIEDPEMRREAIQKEKERIRIKNKLSKEGLPHSTKVILEKQLKEVENELAQIAERFLELDSRRSEVRQRKKMQVKGQSLFDDMLLKDTKAYLENNMKFTLKGKGRFIYAETPEQAQKAHETYVNEFNSKPENKNNQIKIENVADADGFFIGDNYVINKQVAARSGRINVGGHELLHGIIDGFFESLPEEQRKKLIKDFKGLLSKKQLDYINRRLEAYDNIDLDDTVEWFNLFSDGIVEEAYGFDQGVFSGLKNFFEDMLRKLSEAGFIGENRSLYRKEFSNARQVFTFMKDYSTSVKNKKEISDRVKKVAAISAKKKVETGEIAASRSINTQELSDAIDQHVPKDITTNEQFISKDPQTRMSPYDNVLVEIMANNVLDGYISGLVIADKDLGGITNRDDIIENVKFELLKKIRSEYKPIVDGNYRSLFSYIYGAAAQKGKGGIAFKSLLNVKKDYAKRVDRGAASLEVKTPEGVQTRQVEDVTEEASIETEDLSIAKQAKQIRDAKKRKQQGLLEQKQTGKFVNKEYNHSKETNKKVEGVVERVNYDVNKPFEAVKDDMMSMENETDVRTGVKPTGSLFDAFNSISEKEFGVQAKSIMARKQTLSKSENESGRKAIADRVKKEGSLKKYLEKILPDRNYNPKTKKSIGTWAGLIRSLYTDAVNENGKPIRIDNIRGRVLNLDKFTEAQLAEMFGLTPDYKLLPYKKGFKDGMIKGVVVAESVLTINQAARVAAKQPAAPISIGKPKVMFSNSPGEYIKNSYRAATRDIAAELEKRYGSKFLMEGSIKNRPAQLKQIYDKDTNETFEKARDRVVNNFVEDHPRFRDMLMRGLTGGSKRSMYMNQVVFNEKIKQAPKGVEVIEVKRIDYTENRFQKRNIGKYLKDRINLEKNKLKNLKDFFVAIQDYLQKNPKDAWLFLEMLRDSTSAGQSHIIRILAPTKFYTVDQKTKKAILNEIVVQEHTDPQNQIGTALMYAAMNNNVNEVFSVIGGSYMQGSILLTEDNKINNVEKDPNKRSMKTDMPDIYFDIIILRLKNGSLKLPPGMASVVRLAVQGVNLNQLMLVDTNQTIAEYFGVGLDVKNMTNNQINRMVSAQNQLVVMQLTGEITKAKATKAIKVISSIKFKLTKKKVKALINSKDAAVNQIAFSKSPEERGMSTFDFDDTLAKTKSGVRVTLPNLDGKPKPKRKVIFLAGGAGSGKGNVVRKLGLEKQGFKIVNQDISLEWLKKNHGLPADMRNLTKEQRSTLGKLGHQARGIARRKMMKFQGNADGVVVDGTGASSRNMQKLVDEFEAKGYDVSMIYVETSLDVALQRNRARQERSLLDVIVRRNHESVQNNKSTFKEMFGKRFMEVNTDNLTVDSPMPETLTEKVNDFVFGYEKQRIDAEEFAARGNEILEQGGKFDFSEFNEVVEGTPGPLLNKAIERAKKYGTKDMFVLTARPAESAKAIQEFLKSQGLNIPIENITGLADSTGEAKAMWMLQKFAEGYNNLYFVDDAFQNVKAVQDVLNQLDAKSEVVQAKARFSKSASQEFNQIIEESQGTEASRVISQAEAKRLGRHKGWWRIFVPPSAEDFKGLLYRFLGTGKVGDTHMAWFKDNLLDPFAKGIRSWNIYKQNMVNEYKQLKKNFKDVTKSLNDKVPGTTFTVDTAIRVYLWKKAGFEIPGLDIATENKLNDYVLNNIEVRNFADVLSEITQTKDGYVKPSNNWSIQTIATDLNNVVNKIGRKQFLAEYLANVEAIFTPENMNKIEALYGTSFKEALENILYRMENGRNRNRIYDRNSNRLLNWVNGSIGAIMFFNMRSAILQTISTVNFINWSDNNIFKASAAFANQKQFWSDFAMLFNSPQLKQRRAGIQIDVSASELSKAFSDGRGTPQSVINWLLEKGFTPTQIADSFAIAFGGSSFIRNRIKTYMKQGMTEAKAKEKAMLDFQEIAEETQQSSREDLISQQQASVLGRLVLAFQNVTMQYTRLTKKALSDIVNRRGDMKTNISKVIYYGAVQNIIFASLQSALLFILWGDNEDEEVIDDKAKRTLNSAFDSLLRGTGMYGAAVAAIKNTILRWQVEKEKGYGRRDDGRIILEALNFSPPIGSKLRKIYSAIKTESYNMDEISDEIGFRIENPKVYALASIIEAATNIPLQRLVRKANNLEEAITSQHETWQRIALALGWDMWSLGIKDEELEQAKQDVKKNINDRRREDKRKKKEDEEKDMQKKGFKKIRCSGVRSNGERCKIMSDYTKDKKFLCVHHMEFKDGMDRDGDGLKEYRCTAIKSNGKRCKNKTENKNKKCYAHQ